MSCLCIRKLFVVSTRTLSVTIYIYISRLDRSSFEINIHVLEFTCFVCELATGRYWLIHYGPEYIDDEAYAIVPIINKTLRKLVPKIGGAIGCKALVDTLHRASCECYEGCECYHVIALLDAGVVVAESQLRNLLIANCGKYEYILKTECRLKAVEELEYNIRSTLQR